MINLELKNLYIEWAKIGPALSSFQDNTKFNIINKDQMLRCIIMVPDQPQALLNIHCLNDGSTTLDPQVGKNHQLSTELANHIKKLCEISVKNEMPRSRKMDKTQFKLLFEYIESKNVVIQVEKETRGRIQYRLTWHQGGTCYLTRYENDTVLPQGNHRILGDLIARAYIKLNAL